MMLRDNFDRCMVVVNPDIGVIAHAFQKRILYSHACFIHNMDNPVFRVTTLSSEVERLILSLYPCEPDTPFLQVQYPFRPFTDDHLYRFPVTEANACIERVIDM